jgi:hypothetical protein
VLTGIVIVNGVPGLLRFSQSREVRPHGSKGQIMSRPGIEPVTIRLPV